ncbi:MAG: trypsin-like peptidase domain-containing protein [Reyranellales bacterium]
MLIRTNALRALVEAEVGSTPITDKWGEISTVLGQRCGSDVAALFAEPSISRSNGTSESIARWYSDADGPAVSLAALDPAGRGTAAAHLTSLLSRLEPVLRDPAMSSLIGPCVQIPSMADVMVVAGRPVIVNWGFLPEDIAASPARRESHFRTTLGQYLPGISVPPFHAGRGSALTAAPVTPLMAAAAPAAAAAGMAAGSATATAAPATVVVAETARYRPWLPIAIATVVALIALLILLIPGVLVYPDRSIGAADDIELRRQMNRSLEEQVARLKKQLAEAVCTSQNPGGATPVPAGPQRTPAPTSPPTPGDTTPGNTAPGKQGQATPGTPGAPVTTMTSAPASGDARPLSNSDLLAILERATVLVLVASPDPGGRVESIGSGFFVNDRQIVTNRHVIANARPGRVFVANKALAHPVPANIAAMTKASPQSREDFALLEVAQPTGIIGIPLPAATERLSPVTAAGFTGALLKGDEAFTRLLQGDATSMPDMIVTQGIVTVIQQSNGVPLVFHTATISGGNSGGPLADVCGRLVAVNTFTRNDGQRPISFNGALGATSVATFLESDNVGFTRVSGSCETGTPAVPAPAAAGGK